MKRRIFKFVPLQVIKILIRDHSINLKVSIKHIIQNKHDRKVVKDIDEVNGVLKGESELSDFKRL